MSTDPLDRDGDTKMALIKKLRAMLRERDGELSHLRRRLVELEGAGPPGTPSPKQPTSQLQEERQ